MDSSVISGIFVFVMVGRGAAVVDVGPFVGVKGVDVGRCVVVVVAEADPRAVVAVVECRAVDAAVVLSRGIIRVVVVVVIVFATAAAVV